MNSTRKVKLVFKSDKKKIESKRLEEIKSLVTIYIILKLEEDNLIYKGHKVTRDEFRACLNKSNITMNTIFKIFNVKTFKSLIDELKIYFRKNPEYSILNLKKLILKYMESDIDNFLKYADL